MSIKKLTLEEAQKLLIIDRDALDVECATHSGIVDRVGEAYAYAVDRRDTLKAELKSLESEIAIDIRRTAKENDEKLTEAQITQQIHGDRRYKRKNNEYLEANLQVGLWESKRESFRARTRMLPEVCSLFMDGVITDVVVKNKTSDADYETTKRRLSDARQQESVRVLRRKSNEEEDDE